MLGAVVGDVIDSVLLTMMKMVKRFLNRFENNETFTLCIFNILLYWNENWRGLCINLGYIDLDNGTISVKRYVL